jgi:hypothetical protein
MDRTRFRGPFIRTGEYVHAPIPRVPTLSEILSHHHHLARGDEITRLDSVSSGRDRPYGVTWISSVSASMTVLG